MITYKNNFQEISVSKDKYRISNLLDQLLNIKPEDAYLTNLVDLSNKVFEIKTSAIGLLSQFNNENLEDFFISKIKTEKNKFLIVRYIRGLKLNGTDKSVNFLLEFYKKTKSIDVKSEIIGTLQCLNFRITLTKDSLNKIYKLIGNNYPFFQGYWNNLNKAKKTTNLKWIVDGLQQLSSNNLNLLFEYSNEIDFHIQIEKMNTHFIRYINLTAIYKNQENSFSKHFTPTEFYQSENRLFDSILDQSKLMKPENYKDKIINLIENELIPKLTNKGSH